MSRAQKKAERQPIPISASVEVDAPAERVWKVVCDLGRMPAFSPELAKAFVLGRPGVGARIVGINRRGFAVWPTVSRVVRWEPRRAVAWKVRESGATWVYELDEGPSGTTVTGRRILPRFTAATTLAAPLIGGAVHHDRELADGIRATLERIKATVEAA